ncbi:MAG: FCD domain-containing protein [Candidatus Sulfotelmatobacter sp.]|jgi:GntR family transcriptional repressor for pyruvate dehydrogenase complex
MKSSVVRLLGNSKSRLKGSEEPRGNTSSALESLRSFIQDGNLKPDMKLPPERTLAAMLQVGRPALREAIKALSILGALVSRRGDGTYLKSIAAVTSGWPANAEVPEARLDMLELLELRKMVEPRAAGLAASHASVEDLRLIERARVAIENAGSDWKAVGELDFALHQLIITATGNSILRDTYKYLTPLLMKSRLITARTAQDWKRMRKDHAEIVKALVRRDTKAAETSMMNHLHHVGFDLIAARKR